MGVWIEIELGLESFSCKFVAPFVGVWIEIDNKQGWHNQFTVAPFVGVWIEIKIMKRNTMLNVSLPLWECGLK